jgi:hypothetical protein
MLYRGIDRAQLDAAYNNSAAVPSASPSRRLRTPKVVVQVQPTAISRTVRLELWRFERAGGRVRMAWRLLGSVARRVFLKPLQGYGKTPGAIPSS